MRTSLVAVPTADRGARAAYEVVLGADLRGADPVAYSTYVDARDGAVLVRENLVDSRRGQPGVGGLPELAADRLLLGRHAGCAGASDRDRGCDEVGRHAGLAAAVGRRPGDRRCPTNTTSGNNAIAVHNWNSNDPFTVGTETATPRPDRDYVYPWTNQWYEEACNPAVFTSPQRNDIDAARANLFAMHNRMHDWSYHLGFTEATFNMQRRQLRPRRARQRPGAGQRAGRRHHRRAARLRRARQRQPDHAAATASRRSPTCTCGSRSPARSTRPCVDGDYDMSVIAHEYGHAITNRMIAGPNAGRQLARRA